MLRIRLINISTLVAIMIMRNVVINWHMFNYVESRIQFHPRSSLPCWLQQPVTTFCDSFGRCPLVLWGIDDLAGEQDGRVVSTPAFGSEGPRFDPRQQPHVQLPLWLFKQSLTNSWSLFSLFTIPSFGWDVKPRPRVNRLTGAGSLN